MSEYTASYSIGIVANQVGISALYELSNRIAAENNLKVDPSAEIQSVQSNVEKYVRNHPVSVEVTPLQMDSDVPETTPFQSNVPGYAVMFVLLGTASSALTLLEERANGTLRKLLTLPISKFSILGGKMLSNFITAVIQSSILFVIGHFVFGMWLGNSIAGACSAHRLYCVCGYRVGYAHCCISQNKGASEWDFYTIDPYHVSIRRIVVAILYYA